MVSKRAWILRCGLIAALAATAAALYPHVSRLSVEDILTFTPESPALAFAVMLSLYCVKAFVVFIPLTALNIVVGALFPVHWAIPIVYACLSAEMTIGYFMGRRLAKEQVQKLIEKHEKLAMMLSPSDETFNLVCFVAGLLPGPLPLDVMSMLFGATRISYMRFLFFTLLGVSPGILPFVIAGQAIATPLSKEFLIPFCVGLGVTVAVFVAYRLFRRRLDKK